MRSSVGIGLLGAIAVALAVPAAAADEAHGAKKKKQADPNEMVCENQEVLGSRLAVKRVCMTRSQWAEKRRSDRDLVDRSQLGSCMRKSGC